VLELLEAADYFQMAGLKAMCGRLLADTIVAYNCLKLMDKACKYDIKNLKAECNEFFVKNKEEVLSRTPNLQEVVTNIPPLVMECLGIQLENAKL
jgi:hypothetical protein